MTPSANRTTGFTLIELLIVAVVLAIFSAVAVQGVVGAVADGKASAAATSVQAVQRSIDRYHALRGSYPDTLDRAWFQAYKLPHSPYIAAPDSGSVANVQDIEGKVYPSWKSDDRHDMPFWYNKANGVVRIRVPYKGSDAETLALFNQVNGTSATDWDQEQP